MIAAGRKPRRRVTDLKIAAPRSRRDYPSSPTPTTNPGDYAGLDKLVRVVPVTRPLVPHEKKP